MRGLELKANMYVRKKAKILIQLSSKAVYFQ